jgi:hypothetical protein
MNFGLFRAALISLLLLPLTPALWSQQTRVGIRGSHFTINGHSTYTPAQGFPSANPNLYGTLLNVRAVQAAFEDANYPQHGSRRNPYPAHVMGSVWFDYPDGSFDPERNVREFIAALPDWRRCGLLAFTINLQGGGPVDGNYGENHPMQPHVNTAFEPNGDLKPGYLDRVRRILEQADRLGMVVIVGLYYQGQNARVDDAPDGAHIRNGIVNAVRWLKSLPHRNVLIEIQNEVGVGVYRHPLLMPSGAAESIRIAQQEAAGEFPVSISWVSRASDTRALRLADFTLFHTNGRTPEAVQDEIQQFRRLAGYDKPVLINEDGVSAFNLHYAVRERTGWGYYDQGTNNYLDGFQSPPVNWRISSPIKWLFFEQVARLTGSPVPPRPEYNNPLAPKVKLIGLEPNQVIKERGWIEVIPEDQHPRWPIKRVEFYIDGNPVNYRNNAPYQLANTEWWDPQSLTPGPHTLRVAVFDRSGPRFSETCTILEIPFQVEK